MKMNHFPLAAPFLATALLLGGCASTGDFPSLAKRPTESGDPVQTGESAPEVAANPSLPARIATILENAKSGQPAFDAAADAAEAIVAKASASPSRSEAWITAQMALSQVERKRAPVLAALADADVAYREALVSGSRSDSQSVNALRDALQALDTAQADRYNALAARIRSR